jgi:hypothetical protein
MLESQLHESHSLKYNVKLDTTNDVPMAVVEFLDSTNNKLNTLKLKVITADELYVKIEKGEDFILEDSYIFNFSLSEYRFKKGLKEHDLVVLKNFKAVRTFFDCFSVTDFSYAKFEGKKIQFNSCVFGNGLNNFQCADFGNSDVQFKVTRFGSGTNNFQSVVFGEGDITFAGTNFGNGNLIFADAKFSNGNVDFKNTIFGEGNIDFKFAKFSEGNISFERASFGIGKKDFKNVEFGGGRIDFRRVSFNDGDVSFEGAEFGQGKTNFRGASFGKGIKNFNLADFSNSEIGFDNVDFGVGNISYNQAVANHISFNACSFNSFVDFRFAKCNVLNLSNSVIRDIVDIVPEKEEVVIREVNMVNTRILGRLFINWRENEVFKLIYNQETSTYFQKAEQFRILKENFRVNGQYEDEDLAYIEFKRCEALANLNEEKNGTMIEKIFAYPKFYFQKYVFDHVGRYATAPTRVLINAVIAVFIYGIIYYVFTEYFTAIGSVESTLPEVINHGHDFGNNIYYSAITFFTIGYGDYFPHGFLKFVAACEGFSGVFLMSYFTVAFVRKILR